MIEGKAGLIQKIPKYIPVISIIRNLPYLTKLRPGYKVAIGHLKLGCDACWWRQVKLSSLSVQKNRRMNLVFNFTFD